MEASAGKIRRSIVDAEPDPASRRARLRWSALWPWAPVVFAVAYAIVVLVSFRSLIAAINMDSDAVVAPVIGQLLSGAPNGVHVILGNHPWYEALLFLRATAGLPYHRQLWDVSPALWSLAGLGALCWSTWRALGAKAAMLAGCALVCAGYAGRFMFFAFNWHGLSALHTALLGAFVVWLAGAAPRLRRWHLAAVTLAMGALSAMPVSGDPLFLYWALLPAVGTAVLLAWRTRSPAHRRMLAVIVGVAAVALIGGPLLARLLTDHGWVSTPFEVAFVTPQALLGNIVLLFECYTSLAGGSFFGSPVGLIAATLLLSAALFTAALVCIPFELRRRASAAKPAPAPLDPGASRRFAYIAFWACCLVSTSAVFVLTNAPVDSNSARYLLAGYVAVGALLPLLAQRSRGWQASITAGVCLFALIASYQIARDPSQPANASFPTPSEANALVRYAQSEHVSYGYTSYWQAASLTWLSYYKVKLYPVSDCAPPGLTLCPFDTGAVSSWYVRRPRTRSMLIVDTVLQPVLVSAPDPAFGHPAATTTIGALHIYVYPYDIASRFQGAS